MSLTEFFETFPDEDTCRQYIEEARWGDTPICPLCGHTQVYRIAGRMGFKCASCKERFSVRTGTPMANSRIPLRKWLLAIYLMTTARKGISSVQFAKEVGVTQKTAWFMEHRIRAACAGGGSPLSGEVEADESFFGGKARNMHKAQRERRITGRGAVDKAPAMALLQRGGNIQAFAIPDTTRGTLQGAIFEKVEFGSTIYTDEAAAYRSMLGYKHESVRHGAGEYVKGRASTNGVESFWALMKRAYIGTHHWWSVKHLHRYIAEYVYRHNTRHVTGKQIIGEVIRKSEGTRLTYAQLIAG